MGHNDSLEPTLILIMGIDVGHNKFQPHVKFLNLVQLLAHWFFGLAANPIAKSYGWKRYLKKNGLAQLWLDWGLKNMSYPTYG
jgi:hypothetical protein